MSILTLFVVIPVLMLLGTLNLKNEEGILQTCPITASQDVAVRDFGFCFRRLVDGFLLEA